MEDNIQTIIVIIISAFILFVFPVYMAYEKKDDISYALAMRYTQDLVDEVRGKGYITEYMYEDYKAKLKVTGNSYDIQMTHEYNRYDPITNYYKEDDGKYILVKTTTQQEKEAFEQEKIEEGIRKGELAEKYSEDELKEYLKDIYEEENIHKVEDTFLLSKQIFTTDHIENVLKSEKKLLLNANAETVQCDDDEDKCQYAYIMNVDDNFNVTIKNTNTTLATVIYNMVTANTLDNNTRIYVNYGGEILSSKWYGDIDYSKMKHDTLGLNTFEATEIFLEERQYYATKEGGNYPIEKILHEYDDEYILEFDVKPTEVTELREKGIIRLANYTGYNFAFGNGTNNNENSMLSGSVGLNGVTLVANTVVEKSAGMINYMSIEPETRYVERTREDGTKYMERVPVQRKITDFKKMTIKYINGKVDIKLTGKTLVDNQTFTGIINGDKNLLNGLDITIYNPISKIITGELGTALNSRGTKAKYSIIITETTIKVTASQLVSDEITILSYPVAIDNYINVQIEMKKNESGKYTASLYLDNLKVDESIELDVAPKVNVIGKTIIGNEERFFEGYIKNVKIYN